MNYFESQQKHFIEGVQRDYCIIQDTQMIDELNNRLSTRQFSDSPLRPNFSSRPVSTKYAHFPLIDMRKTPTVPIEPVNVHNVETNFNPGTEQYPYSSYLANYSTEEKLRKFHFKYDSDTYVPSSNSDMFKVSPIHITTRNEEQTHPLLFSKPGEEVYTSVPDIVNERKVGGLRLYNDTRLQLRGL